MNIRTPDVTPLLHYANTCLQIEIAPYVENFCKAHNLYFEAYTHAYIMQFSIVNRLMQKLSMLSAALLPQLSEVDYNSSQSLKLHPDNICLSELVTSTSKMPR